ncbi:MAG TPA: ABC transporter ATP-binding protein [Candidatus Methanoperedens sp.]
MENSHVLEINSVSKYFGSLKALDNVNLAVGRGEVFGLLGPNGSGKSTLMKMILGLMKPDAGTIKVDGIDVRKDSLQVRRIVGYVPETPRVYEFLTAIEYLDFIADIHQMDLQAKKERIGEFIRAFELEGRENEMLSGYSQGMKQKAVITAALIHKPKLLVMDEPLNGLDPRSARIVKDLIHQLSKEGVSTIFSTHVLEIAEAVCDRIAIMSGGSVLAEGTATDLRSQAGMPGSTLEELFLKMTGTGDVKDIVEALLK